MRLIQQLTTPALALALASTPVFAASEADATQTTSNPVGSAAEVRQETQELLKDLQAYGAEQRDEAVAASQAALDKADQRIDAMQDWLDENWSDMSQAAREQARASMDALRARRTQVAESYGSMKTSSETAWESMKEGFVGAYQALGDAWDDSMQALFPEDNGS
ncbi:sll1863 family stress response protein [Thiorhodovibrio frisius]|uniref:Uncharacterized protein n=1 Tax=Thiorhodovibrio frisius TaxID=631362 RepID=H8Z0P5_9GAMM|nr:hypothetical protein [Thiorhodovibrio frisius]EIC22386.1 hypothetical protein Thi970DRAFT_02646 [Thiorhodovibrio frisius]WPL24685.1 hypothetical protein Thiofri_04905 [Thiorhodovibrio frisius]